MTKRFQTALDGLREEDGFPGATAAFILPDGVVVGIASGFSDKEKGIAMSGDALQPIGNVEESFASLVALSLYQDNVLDLDEQIHEYFDSEGAWLSGVPNGKKITLRHLLTHSSGLTAQPEGEIELAVNTEPDFEPGQGFAAVNTDYRYVTKILQEVSTENYHTLFEERVLNRFELLLTESLQHSKLENVSPGYRQPLGGEGEITKVNSPEVLNRVKILDHNVDSILSNPQDLVRWAQLLYEEDALDGSYMEDLFASGYRGSDRDSEFGLGVYIHETTAGEAYGHAGKVDGYETALIYFPKYRVGVCIQVNRSYDNDLRKYVEQLAQVVLNSIPE